LNLGVTLPNIGKSLSQKDFKPIIGKGLKGEIGVGNIELMIVFYNGGK
jgi:hypothetical protein